MKILHTTEFYSPSVGGAQEVIKQISERLVERGHDVTVATTRLNNRETCRLNGVKIEEFDISGNAVTGMVGDVERYQKFLLGSDFDIMLNYAAQEWTMDAAFPVLDRLPYRKVMIPCGFSGLLNPKFQDYFLHLPLEMKKYDRLVFHANEYMDINFARLNGISNLSIIPNGASEEEFSANHPDFRLRHHISDDVPILLTVGSHSGIKGHQLVMKSFQQLKIKKGVLVIIGNIYDSNNSSEMLFEQLYSHIKHLQIDVTVKLIIKALLGRIEPGCLPDCRGKSRWINLTGFGNKKVLLLDPPRSEVVSAYHAADLFVFGSNLEYSPLVLFEAAASHTPFITLECGNAREIVDWTGGGIIAPTIKKKYGMVYGNSTKFATMIEQLLNDPQKRKNLGETGHSSWLKNFTWKK
jgi:glycosyltransferase involved in cell wall biosynthesis